MRRRVQYVPAGLLLPEPERPAPRYPEYVGLLEDAEAASKADHGFVDPVKLRRSQNIGRGWEWRVCVLGHDRNTSLVEMHMLLLADERDLKPPVPQWLLDARAEGERHDAERRAARQARDEADEAAWRKVLEQSAVKDELEVLRNGTARVRYGISHHLGHVVPKVDMRSGAKRRHRAGRALCETEGRAKPLDLSGEQGGPATCMSCLEYTPKIRPAAV